MSYKPPYEAPTGPGKPRNEANLPIRIDNFAEGIDVRFDNAAARGFTVLRVNGVPKRGRTLDRRDGYTELGSASAGKIYMGASLQKFNADDDHIRIVNGAVSGVQLEKWNGSAWATLGSEITGASNRSDWFSANTYISANRLYFCNGVDTLRYTNGSTISTVTDTQGIKAKYITSLENILVLGHFTATFAPNQIAYAKAGTHQFRRDEDTDFSESTNIITLDGEVTQVQGFNWLIYAFTRSDGLWEIDLNTTVPRRISTHGTLAPKSVATGEDMMVWADQDGVWGIATGSRQILELSEPIADIWGNISVSSVFNMNAGISPQGDYKIAIGDVTYDGVAYSDAVLVYHIRESRRQGQHVWSLQSGKPANYWWQWTNASGITNLYFGSIDEGAVFTDDSGSTDDGANISMIWQSRDFPLVDELMEATLSNVYIRYKPDASNTIPLTVEYRRNMGAWDEFDSKALTLPTGSVDMAYARVSVPPGITGRTLALRLTSSSAVALRIYEVLLTYNLNESEIPLT